MGVAGEIRRELLEMDQLEAVIGLDLTLFYGTGLAACILIFRNHKKVEQRGRVLIINASKSFKKGHNQNILLPEHIDQIFTVYKEYTDKAGISKVFTLNEIAQNDWNLNIRRYIEAVTKEEASSVAEALANLKTALDEA